MGPSVLAIIVSLASAGTGGAGGAAPGAVQGLGAQGVADLVGNAGAVAKVVLCTLLGLSVIGWAIIFQKALWFPALKWETARFLRVYHESRLFSAAAAAAKRFASSPLAHVYAAAFEELGRYGNGERGLPDQMDGPAGDGDPRGAGGIGSERLDAAQRAMRAAQAFELGRMERYLSFLATTASAAPFIGLFGTVWGIMAAFHSIGAQGSASLAVVAPGIAEALIATAAGLGAAIPAVVGYNYFLGRVRRWATEMDNFALELANLAARRLARAVKSN